MAVNRSSGNSMQSMFAAIRNDPSLSKPSAKEMRETKETKTGWAKGGLMDQIAAAGLDRPTAKEMRGTFAPSSKPRKTSMGDSLKAALAAPKNGTPAEQAAAINKQVRSWMAENAGALSTMSPGALRMMAYEKFIKPQRFAKEGQSEAEPPKFFARFPDVQAAYTAIQAMADKADAR